MLSPNCAKSQRFAQRCGRPSPMLCTSSDLSPSKIECGTAPAISIDRVRLDFPADGWRLASQAHQLPQALGQTLRAGEEIARTNCLRIGTPTFPERLAAA